MIRGYIKFFAAVIFLGYVPASIGQNYFNFRDDEIERLPEYCLYSQFYSLERQNAVAEHPRKKYWDSVNGPDQIHIHHFCNAHIWHSRSISSRDPARVKLAHEKIVSEIDYVLRHLIDPKYRLLPEIHTMRGASLAALKKHADAEAAFSRALAANPGYVKAYGHAAENKILQKQFAEARDWAQRGLKIDPSNSWLNEILKLSSK